jgi:peptidoglycan hydrolase-like protein with peptidoglycan-binding domain
MAVRLVQRRLDVPVSGRYDRRTVRAVKRLQARAELRPSGVVRRSTWRALRS